MSALSSALEAGIVDGVASIAAVLDELVVVVLSDVGVKPLRGRYGATGCESER